MSEYIHVLLSTYMWSNCSDCVVCYELNHTDNYTGGYSVVQITDLQYSI